MSYVFLFFVFFYTSACKEPDASTSNKDISIENNQNQTPIPYKEREITHQTLQQLLQKSDLQFHFEQQTQLDDGIMVPLQNATKEFHISVQHISSPPMLYMSVNDYLWLDQSKTPRSTSFTLTQIAIQNHAIVGAKIQLNPRNGAITFAHEIHIPNGIDEDVFVQSVEHMVEEAIRHYPMLKASLEEDGY